MADKDDNVESRSSSLGIISDFLSSFTSVGSSNSDGEDTDVESTDLQQNTSTDSEQNTTDVESGGTTDDDDHGERRQSSLEKITDFLSSFTSSGSADDSSLESKTADEDGDSEQLQPESSDSAEQNISEEDKGDIAEDSSAFEMHRQSSLDKISDFLQSFTTLGSSSTETTDDNNNNQTDEDNAQQENVYSDNEDVILEDDDSEGTIPEGRLRSSSSRIFTEPESIDKKDLDYVTLVSS